MNLPVPSTPESWSGFSIARKQSVKKLRLKPLQLAMAYSAIAMGVLMKPRLVSQIVNNNGKPVYREEPEVLRKSLNQVS
ncbi:MAG: hypothetical protein CM1200mP10_30910 [Candidatus Neomarinimicrobiota bacterium]|nr:MAG: hypothetical protein CM1200mP10_30910 [Candidatus Neomarinimicrobiota bacterium]